MGLTGWWNGRPSAARFDLYTRVPLYVVSASAPLVLLMLLGSQQGVRPRGVVLLVALNVAHTLACLWLLRASLAAQLGGPRPGARLMIAAAALTVAGVAAGPAAVPTFGQNLGANGFPIGLALTVLFCGALTAAITPLLRGRYLLMALALPAVILTAAQALAGQLASQTPWAVNYLLVVGILILTYSSSAWVLRLVWEIDRARDVQAKLAVAEERLRVARDLHDVLGRNLTLVAVHSELAAQLVHRRPDEAADRMLDVRRVAQDSMREVREVVGGHRATDLDAELTGARALLRSAGIDARVIGDSTGLPPTVHAALGWAVREAITNIIRHADAKAVTIDLTSVPGPAGRSAVLLKIENDGVRDSNGDVEREGHGTGLAGLRERLGRLGGTVGTQTIAGGRFVLEVQLPIPATPRAGTSTSLEPAS